MLSGVDMRMLDLVNHKRKIHVCGPDSFQEQADVR